MINGKKICRNVKNEDPKQRVKILRLLCSCNVLTFGICLFIVTNTETITPDMAGAMLALALQLSVLYQMSLRNDYNVIIDKILA